MKLLLAVLLFAAASAATAATAPIRGNLDESKVAPYTLPDVLLSTTGAPIRDIAAWRANRPALLEIFSREVYGRTPAGRPAAMLNKNFPFWFALNFRHYDGHEADLPVDQHQLLALIAPRPLYVASASEDLHADPKGEFLAAKFAEPVYALFGKKGLGVATQPAPDTPVGDTIGCHVRTGAHNILAYDWDQYLNFADRHLK